MALADLGNVQRERAHPGGEFPGPGAVAVPLALRRALIRAGLQLLPGLCLEHLVEHLLPQDLHPVIALKQLLQIGAVDGTPDSQPLPRSPHVGGLRNPIVTSGGLGEWLLCVSELVNERESAPDDV